MKQNLLNLIVKGLLATIFILQVDITTAATLTRGPYLQTGTSTSVIVRWRSDEATNSRVRIGASPSTLNKIIDNSQSTTEHIVQINGLTPNTKYFYAIGSTTERLSGGDANTYFSTAPETGARLPFRAGLLVMQELVPKARPRCTTPIAISLDRHQPTCGFNSVTTLIPTVLMRIFRLMYLTSTPTFCGKA
jgi:hypothetical protein